MNEYLQQIFEAQGQEIDPEVAAAGALLSKVAEEQGVDLDTFSDEDVAGMLQNIMGTEVEPEKVAHVETPSAAELTVADVSAELYKVAAQDGIDLASLDRQQSHDVFNWMHEQMSDPAYFSTKVAMEEKVAEADMIGRVMAHSFDDELTKMSGRIGNAAERLGKGVVRTLGRTGGAEAAMKPGTAKAIGGATVAAGGAAAAGLGLGARKLYKKMKGKGEEEGGETKESGVTEEDLLVALTEFGWDFS